MTNGRNPSRIAFGRTLLLAALLSLWVVGGRAAPSIEVHIGFNGHVVPERYAPLRVRVRGYDGPGTAHLVVTQLLGSEWRDTATVRQQPDITVSADGWYATAIPVYEPLNPIEVALIGKAGTSLAESTVNLRMTRHMDPFTLLYGGLPYAMSADDGPVTALELPDSWWAFDAVGSLWLSAPPPRNAWTALAQWVLSGGSVVIVAGPDYFRFDAPVVREILPIADPTIEARPDGLLCLSGVPRGGASVSVTRGDLPLLVDWRYGAGYVGVVTLRAADLTVDDLARISKAVPESERISMTAVSETLLGDLPVVRPTYLSALVVLAASVATLAGVVLLGQRRRVAGYVSAASLFAALSVWFGLQANTTNDQSYLYAISTRLQLESSVGIEIVSCSFYSLDDRPGDYQIGSESLPALAPPAPLAKNPIQSFLPLPSATPSAYEHDAAPGHVTTSAIEVRQRTFYAYASSPPLLRLTVDPVAAVATLDNRGAARPVDCWLLYDGMGVRVPSVQSGTNVFSLRSGQSFSSLVSEADDRASLILQHLVEELPLHEGVWFVGLAPFEDPTPRLPGQEVRHLDVYVVKGEVS